MIFDEAKLDELGRADLKRTPWEEVSWNTGVLWNLNEETMDEIRTAAVRDLAEDETTLDLTAVQYRFSWNSVPGTVYQITWIETFQPEDGDPVHDLCSTNLVATGPLTGCSLVVESPKTDGVQRIALVGLGTETAKKQPIDRTRRKIGIGEEVALAITSPADAVVDWSITAGSGVIESIADARAIFAAAEKRERVTVRATLTNYGRVFLDTAFQVITPESVCLEKLDGEGGYATTNHCLVAFLAHFYFGPDDVNFYNVKAGEASASPFVSGYFDQSPYNTMVHPAWIGGPNGNLTDTVVPGKGTKSDSLDLVQMEARCPFSDGHFHWDLRWMYQLPAFHAPTQGVEFATVRQSCDLTVTSGVPGSVTVKGGKGNVGVGPFTAVLP